MRRCSRRLSIPRATSARCYSRDMSLCRVALHRGKAGPHLRRALPGHRQGPGRLRGQLRRRDEGADACCRRRFRTFWSSANKGIAVGMAMASDICGFNLHEVCRTDHRISSKTRTATCWNTLPAPDFSTGGEIIYRREEMERIYQHGHAAVFRFARAGATCPKSASSRYTRFLTPRRPMSSSSASSKLVQRRQGARNRRHSRRDRFFPACASPST